ncbi:hypothetical protein BD413DRAFT_470278 [Trametes elegans]|nr:hypothetical protein BD413DRAFT_470278 [Trametes elegans]
MKRAISDRRRAASRPVPPPLHLNRLSSLEPESSEVTTTVFVSNMHCGSCVKTIQDALTALSPSPSAVDVSIVTQSVTVKHPRALPPAMIKAAIDGAGYDILSTPAVEDSSRPPLSWSGSIARLSHFAASKRKRHLDNCAQCRAEQATEALPAGETSASVDKVSLGVNNSVCLLCIGLNARTHSFESFRTCSYTLLVTTLAGWVGYVSVRLLAQDIHTTIPFGPLPSRERVLSA